MLIIRIIQKVAGELERNLKGKQMISSDTMKGAAEKVLPKLEKGIEPTIPNLLSRPALVANAILRQISKTRTAEYNRIATELMQNPQKLAELLQGPPESATTKVAKQIYQDILPALTGQETGREVETQ